MKLYKDLYEIPIKNWNQIQRSFETVPDYSPLIKSGKYRKRFEKKLQNKYKELTYQIPAVDNELNKAFLTYHLEMQKYIASIGMNELRKKSGFTELEINKYPANRAFQEYFELLKERYTDFEFEVCKTHPRFNEIYEKVTGKHVPEGFTEKTFFLFQEFQYDLSEFDDEFQMNVLIGYNTLIQSEMMTLSDIDSINSRLERNFKAMKKYDDWFLIRYNFFNLSKLRFRSDKDNNRSILSEAILLGRILQQPVNPNEVTVGDLFDDYRRVAKNIVEQSKINPNG